ncbi:MAG: serine/threonine protein kinase [Spirochaetes bacterium]|nr:serine/threonine protein kinase [Spirochaetota bacterium]MBU0955784.1 serine/threonine protein kinase [Spirochaetota bacterium]
MKILAERFELLRELGHGGLATVFLARDRLMQADIALKLIHEHLAGDPAILERFRQELSINRLARHPNVVEYYELFDTDGLKFLTLEYMAGGDLKQRITRDGFLPVSMAVDIGLHILDALEQAHSKGIVHGDIKPHNILFTLDGRPKLSDFGLSRLSSGENHARGQVNAGTPEYTPPELVLGQIADARSDLYSFGISLFELLCGKLPFSANSALGILHAQVYTPLPNPRTFRPELPAALAELLMRVLQKNPLDRFQSAALFRLALEQGGRQNTSARLFQVSAKQVDGEPLAEALNGAYCPNCGQKISSLLPYCFTCAQNVGSLQAARAGTDTASVYILGPGSSGSKIAVQDRQNLIELLESGGADTAVLRKKLPRLPFVLISGLTPLSARQLTERIEALGIEAVAGSLRQIRLPEAVALPELLTKEKSAHAKFREKEKALVLRRLVVLAGSSTWLWINMGRVLENFERGFFGIIALLVIASAGVAVATRLNSRRNQARLLQKNAVGNRWLLVQRSLNPLCGPLEVPALKGLAAAVVQKLQRLLDEGRLDKLSESELADFLSDLDAWVQLCLAAQDIERFLRQNPESAMLRQADPVSAGLASEVARRRDLEQCYNYIFDRLLSFNTSLDALLLSVVGAGQAGLLRDMAELNSRLDQARVMLDDLEKGAVHD